MVKLSRHPDVVHTELEDGAPPGADQPLQRPRADQARRAAPRGRHEPLRPPTAARRVAPEGSFSGSVRELQPLTDAHPRPPGATWLITGRLHDIAIQVSGDHPDLRRRTEEFLGQLAPGAGGGSVDCLRFSLAYLDDEAD